MHSPVDVIRRPETSIRAELRVEKFTFQTMQGFFQLHEKANEYREWCLMCFVRLVIEY